MSATLIVTIVTKKCACNLLSCFKDLCVSIAKPHLSGFHLDKGNLYKIVEICITGRQLIMV